MVLSWTLISITGMVFCMRLAKIYLKKETKGTKSSTRSLAKIGSFWEFEYLSSKVTIGPMRCTLLDTDSKTFAQDLERDINFTEPNFRQLAKSNL